MNFFAKSKAWERLNDYDLHCHGVSEERLLQAHYTLEACCPCRLPERASERVL